MTTKNIVILVVLVGLVGTAGGYATGRYAAPARTIVTEKVVEVEKVKIVTQIDTQKILDAIKASTVQKDVHTTRVIQKAKDGSVTITETKDDKTKSETKSETKETDNSKSTQVVEKLVYKDREVTKIVERQNHSQWALSLQPGFEFGSALGLGGQPYSLLSILPVKHVMANLTIERRLFGPLFLGAWANTHLDGGVSLRLEW